MLTKKIYTIVATAILAVMSFTAASAADFEPSPLTVNTQLLEGCTFEVKFAGLETDGLSACIADGTSSCLFPLTDASGKVLPSAVVTAELLDSYTVSFKISGVGSAINGTYKVPVPANAFTIADIPISIGNDAFEITVNYNNGQGGGEEGGGEEGGGEEGGEETDDPSKLGNVATFILDNHKEENSIYYDAHDIIKSNVNGVDIKFVRAGKDTSSYSWNYKTWYGYTQFKDCEFIISAPNAAAHILKIEFVPFNTTSPTYSVDNLVAEGYEEGVWKGNAHDVTFSTLVYQQPIYDWSDDELDEEPIITGYTEEITGTRVTKIYVYLDVDVKKEEVDGISTTVSPLSPLSSGIKYDLQGRQYNGTGKLHKGSVIVR